MAHETLDLMIIYCLSVIYLFTWIRVLEANINRKIAEDEFIFRIRVWLILRGVKNV